MKHSVVLLVLFPLLSFVSCAARYDVALTAEGAASIELSASVGPRTANLIANLAGTPAGDAVPLLDASEIGRALRSSAGVRAVDLRNRDPRSLAGRVSVDDFSRFLSPRFIRVERTGSGGRASIDLDRSSAAELLASLSPDIGDYLSALMAPVSTGDSMTAEEYVGLVSSVYGEGVAREIREARVLVSLDLPGEAFDVKGGTAAGRAAEFTLPLLDFLTLEKPISLGASWRRTG